MRAPSACFSKPPASGKAVCDTPSSGSGSEPLDGFLGKSAPLGFQKIPVPVSLPSVGYAMLKSKVLPKQFLYSRSIALILSFLILLRSLPFLRIPWLSPSSFPPPALTTPPSSSWAPHCAFKKDSRIRL